MPSKVIIVITTNDTTPLRDQAKDLSYRESAEGRSARRTTSASLQHNHETAYIYIYIYMYIYIYIYIYILFTTRESTGKTLRTKNQHLRKSLASSPRVMQPWRLWNLALCIYAYIYIYTHIERSSL